MIIGPIQISFAPPFFIFAGVLMLMSMWLVTTRVKRANSYIPHSHGILAQRKREKRLNAAHKIKIGRAHV